MGLFGRKRAATPWRLDGAWKESTMDHSGDFWCGDSYGARFARGDLPGSLMTVTFCAVETGRGGWEIRQETLLMVVEDPADPGETVTWSAASSQVWPLGRVSFGSEAERLAFAYSRHSQREVGLFAAWDGEPFDVDAA